MKPVKKIIDLNIYLKINHLVYNDDEEEKRVSQVEVVLFHHSINVAFAIRDHFAEGNR